jgi:outer membrane protein assembly factor BamD (BamD/ComL family)
MVENSSFTSLKLYCLVFIVLTNKGFADRQLLLEQAGSYLESSNNQQATSTYPQIVSDYPGTYYALEAQKQLIITYIAWDKIGF